jgi:hypothetical protein
VALLASTLICGTAAAQNVAYGFRPLTDFAQLTSYPLNESDMVGTALARHRHTLALNTQDALSGTNRPVDPRSYVTWKATTEPRRKVPRFSGGFGMPGPYGPYGWNSVHVWYGPYRYYGSFGWDWGDLSNTIVGKLLNKLDD